MRSEIQQQIEAQEEIEEIDEANPARPIDFDSIHRPHKLRGAKRKGKYAVAVITAPADWRPRGLEALPVEIVSARFHVRRISCRDACTVAQSFNLAQMQRLDAGEAFDGQWAVVISPMFGIVPHGTYSR